MSNYTKTTNFATKDNLSSGNPLKIVKGTEIDTEFNNIATAVATKTDNSAAAITGGTITGITDLAVADGGTGASTAAGALNNLLPSQTGNANKYLQTDGTNATWDAVSLSTSDITGTLPVANGGTGVTSSTGTGNVVLSNSPTLVTPALGTPASGTATNLTGLPISTGVSGLGAGVATLLATPSSANLASAITDETGSGALVFATSPTLVTPILGTPTSGTLTNATGLPISTGVSGLGTGVATFLGTPSSANLLAAVSDETGTGSLVFATSPTLVTPALGTPSALVGTNITGTASGLTAGNVTTNANLTGAVTSVGNATSLGSFTSSQLLSALTDETGTGANVFATSPTLVTPILGTPTSATLTNATGLPLTTGVTGQLPVANGGTGTATPSIVAGTNVTVTGTWPNQTIAASGGGGSGTVTSVAATVPSLFSISGSPITTSGTLAMTYSGTALPVANGGTGLTTTPANGALDIGNGTGFTRTTLTAGSNITITNGAGSISIAASGGGASAATPTVEGTVFGKMTASGGTPFLTALGYNAGLNNTGVSNSAVGWEALKANTSGTFSTAVGYQAGASIVSSNRLTAVGYQAGYLSTAASNSFFGAYAGNQISTGIANTGIGDAALGNAANTGSYNTALGQGALGNISTSSNSVGVGYLAGNLITTGGKNTIIGGYNGNQDGLDIRTASSYAIIADGDGNRQITMKEGQTLALDSAVPNAGTGITFPATQSASTDANTLDDYEEGTFTPAFTGSTVNPTVAYNWRYGYYTKVGNQVTLWFGLNVSSITVAGSGNLGVTLPFTSLNRSDNRLPGSISGGLSYTSGASIYPLQYENQSYILFRQYDSTGGSSYLSVSSLTIGNSVQMTMTYAV